MYCMYHPRNILHFGLSYTIYHMSYSKQKLSFYDAAWKRDMLEDA